MYFISQGKRVNENAVIRFDEKSLKNCMLQRFIVV